MIKKIEIKNFQSHKHSLLEFSPGLNVIIGETDQGKSAVRRALRWVIYNKPDGDDFRSNWGGDTSVTIWDYNGNEITRFRSNSENKYILNGADLKGFKGTVPDEIREVLNFNDINHQAQSDSHFLLSKTAGEVAKHFNQLANLKVIDDSTRYLKSKLTQLNQTFEFNDKQRKENREKLQAYEKYELFEIELETLEDVEKEKIQLSFSLSRLSKLVESIQEVSSDIEELEKYLLIEGEMTQVFTWIERRDFLREKQNTLSQLISNIQIRKLEIEKYKKTLLLDAPVKELENLIQKRNDLKHQINTIVTAVDTIYNSKIELRNLEKIHAGLVKEFSDNMPDRCPLCETDLKHEHNGTN